MVLDLVTSDIMKAPPGVFNNNLSNPADGQRFPGVARPKIRWDNCSCSNCGCCATAPTPGPRSLASGVTVGLVAAALVTFRLSEIGSSEVVQQHLEFLDIGEIHALLGFH